MTASGPIESEERPMSTYPVITLRPADGVAVARGAIEPGMPVADGVAAAS